MDDPLYSGIYSVSQPGWYLHARGDAPEVRTKFIEFLRELHGYKVYIVIGRKKLSTFAAKHNNNEKEYYFDLVHHLFSGLLQDKDKDYRVFLSARERNTQNYLQNAIDKAITRDNHQRHTPLEISYQHDIVRSQDTPELSIIDYHLWALQRYILQGESRFYNALLHNYASVIDLYDDKSNGKTFSPDDNFRLDRVGEFRSDGYM